MVERRKRGVPLSKTPGNTQAALNERAAGFDPSIHARKVYGEKTKVQRSLIERRWDKYHASRSTNRDEQLIELQPSTIYGFLHWMLSNFAINRQHSLRTYWDGLRTLHLEAACVEEVNPVISHLAAGIRAQLAQEFGLIAPGDVTEEEEKRCVRAEELFAFEQTLWCSKRMTLKCEDLRAEISLAMILAGLSGSRPAALLGLKWGDVKFIVYPDELRGTVPTIKIRYRDTKTYLGPKKPNTQTYPGMYEPCLLLDPQVAMFGLALARKIFHPKAGLVDAGSIYRVQVPSGLKSQPLPLDPDKLDDPVFSELTYAILRTALKRIAQFTGIEWDTKPYTFRYGHGEEINLSRDISPEQQALVLGHQHIGVYQRNYQPNDIRADLQAAYHGTRPQSDVLRLATSMIQSQDPRRPSGLDDVQREQLVNNDPEVVRSREEWQNVKLKRKRDDSEDEVQAKKKEYLAVKKRCHRRVEAEVKKKFSQEQPVLDIQRQLQGLPVNVPQLDTSPEQHHLPERKEAIAALMVQTNLGIGEESACRVRAVQAIANLCGKRERYVPGRQSRMAKPSEHQKLQSKTSDAWAETVSVESAERTFPMECEPTQCIFCLGDQSMSYQDRTQTFATRSSLNRHMKDIHFGKWNGAMQCPHPCCAEIVESLGALRAHAERDHKILLSRARVLTSSFLQQPEELGRSE